MENNEVFVLKSLSINMIEYGDNRGQYRGKVSYISNEGNEFGIVLTPEDHKAMLSLISKALLKSAERLGNTLEKSLAIELDSPVVSKLKTI